MKVQIIIHQYSIEYHIFKNGKDDHLITKKSYGITTHSKQNL